MKKCILMISLMGMTIGLWANGNGENGSSIRLSMGGSTTVEPIITSAMEVYMDEIDPAASLSYDAPGSTAGIRGVLNGVYDMGAASRELLISEEEQGVRQTHIALDGIAVIVNDSVPLNDITLENLAAIFVGEIQNWKDLGGPDKEIVVINRDEASGTLGAFEELVLEKVYGDDGRFLRNALITESNGNMATMVSQTPYSIGYGSLAIVKRLEQSGGKALSVNGIEDNTQNVTSRAYPIVRPLSVITYGEPAGDALIFLEFLKSDRGRELILDAQFIPMD